MSRKTEANVELMQEVRRIHATHDAVYGSPKVWPELRAEGQRYCRHRVVRLMKQAGLQGIPVKKRGRSRKAGKRPTGVSNQLARDFSAATHNTKWVTDITYTRTTER